MEYPQLTSYKPAAVLVKALVAGLIIAILVYFFLKTYDGVIKTDRRYVIAFILGCVAAFLVYQLQLRYEKKSLSVETTENNFLRAESDLESVVSTDNTDKPENYF